MKTKTNKEIIAELQTRGRFRTPEEVDIYFREALEAKDTEAVVAVEIAVANLERVHREKMIEMVKSAPGDEKDCIRGGFSGMDYGYNKAIKEIKKWKANQLNKLKNES